jgi:hypothetical protein
MFGPSNGSAYENQGAGFGGLAHLVLALLLIVLTAGLAVWLSEMSRRRRVAASFEAIYDNVNRAINAALNETGVAQIIALDRIIALISSHFGPLLLVNGPGHPYPVFAKLLGAKAPKNEQVQVCNMKCSQSKCCPSCGGAGNNVIVGNNNNVNAPATTGATGSASLVGPRGCVCNCGLGDWVDRSLSPALPTRSIPVVGAQLNVEARLAIEAIREYWTKPTVIKYLRECHARLEGAKVTLK